MLTFLLHKTSTFSSYSQRRKEPKITTHSIIQNYIEHRRYASATQVMLKVSKRVREVAIRYLCRTVNEEFINFIAAEESVFQNTRSLEELKEFTTQNAKRELVERFPTWMKFLEALQGKRTKAKPRRHWDDVIVSVMAMILNYRKPLKYCRFQLIVAYYLWMVNCTQEVCVEQTFGKEC